MDKEVDVKAQLEELRSHKEDLQQLVKHPGWAHLAECWRKQIIARAKENGAFTPTLSVEAALTRNVQVGIILGLKLAYSLPNVFIAERQEEIDQLLEEIRNATGEPTAE